MRSIIESINKYFEEELAHFEEPNWTEHHNKRIEKSLEAEGEDAYFEIPPDMTKEEYDRQAHLLTSARALPITSENATEIQGYITQRGRKVKFEKDTSFPAAYFYASYIGDDINGTVITLFKTKWNYIVSRANPETIILDPRKDYRYKCDLDGGFRGLNIFTDIGDETREKILNGEPLQ